MRGIGAIATNFFGRGQASAEIQRERRTSANNILLSCVIFHAVCISEQSIQRDELY